MRSRLAITLMLVFGFALSGAGGAMAISGGNTAADAQYGTTPPPPTYQVPSTPGTPATPGVTTTPPGTTAPTPETPTPVAPEDTTTPPTLGGGGVKGETEEQSELPAQSGPAPTSEVAPAEEVQEVQQVAAQEAGQALPFTGFAAIPILLLGLGLVAAGLILRRGAGSSA